MTQPRSPMHSQWIKTAPGVRRRTVAVGERLFQMLVEFEPGASTPTHAHPHEQVIHVIRGGLRLMLADGTVELSTGESYWLLSNVPHGAEAQTGALLLDTFSPPREDLIAQDAMIQVK
jgi:quercetin dioxygenase-like cupin family protein